MDGCTPYVEDKNDRVPTLGASADVVDDNGVSAEVETGEDGTAPTKSNLLDSV